MGPDASTRARRTGRADLGCTGLGGVAARAAGLRAHAGGLRAHAGEQGGSGRRHGGHAPDGRAPDGCAMEWRPMPPDNIGSASSGTGPYPDGRTAAPEARART